MRHADKLILINFRILIEIDFAQKLGTDCLVNFVCLHELLLIEFAIEGESLEFLLKVVNLALVESPVE